MNKWENEPNELKFEAFGLNCVMWRHPMWRSWCGYVEVQQGHPFYKKSYSERVNVPIDWLESTTISSDELGIIPLVCANPGELKEGIVPIDLLIRCHGGVTYSGEAYWSVEDASRKGWWFGFDCGHSGIFSLGWGRGHGGICQGFIGIRSMSRRLVEKWLRIW